MSLEQEIGAKCQLPECARRDYLPRRCDLCQGVFCTDHADFHGCSVPRPARKHTGSDAPDQQLFKCSVPKCGESELVRVDCKRCKKTFCIAHRLPKSHACTATAAVHTTTTKSATRPPAQVATAVRDVSTASTPSSDAPPIVVLVQFPAPLTLEVTVPASATGADLMAAILAQLPADMRHNAMRLRFVRHFVQPSERLADLGFGTRAAVVADMQLEALEAGLATAPPTTSDPGCFGLMWRSVFG